MTGQPKNILIIKPSALGDIVLALPALSAIRRSFPQARISWLVRPEFADLLRGHPDLDELILFDRRLLGKWWCKPKAFGELMRLFSRLRGGRFDLVFDFQGLFRTGFFGWVTGCKKRFGMGESREFACMFYTDKIEQDSSCIHLVDYYLKMVALAGAQKGGIEFKLPQDTSADEQVRKLLTSKKVNVDNYVVLVPGAAQPEKRWPVERFAQLADKIADKFGMSTVATGSESERAGVDVLLASAKSYVVNLAGRTTIRELISLVKGASLVISNDTGPGHIAAALSVPVVMIFGPTNPARVCPYQRPDCVVAIDPATRGMKADSYDPKHSIDQITVDAVFEKVCEQISKKGS
jgi:heptosyltransferase I